MTDNYETKYFILKDRVDELEDRMIILEKLIKSKIEDKSFFGIKINKKESLIEDEVSSSIDESQKSSKLEKENYKKELEQHKNKIKELERNLKDKDELQSKLEKKDEELKVAKNALEDKKDEIKKIKNLFEEKERAFIKLDNILEDKEEKLRKVEAELEEKSDELRRTKRTLEDKEDELRKVKLALKEQEDKNIELKRKQAEFESLLERNKIIVDKYKKLNDAYEIYNKLSDESKSRLNLIKDNDELNFLLSCVNKENIENLHEYIATEITNGRMNDVEALKSVFDYFFSIYNNINNNRFERAKIKIGARFDSQNCAKIEGRATGNIEEILFLGFNDVRNEKVIKKTVVNVSK